MVTKSLTVVSGEREVDVSAVALENVGEVQQLVDKLGAEIVLEAINYGLEYRLSRVVGLELIRNDAPQVRKRTKTASAGGAKADLLGKLTAKKA